MDGRGRTIHCDRKCRTRRLRARTGRLADVCPKQDCAKSIAIPRVETRTLIFCQPYSVDEPCTLSFIAEDDPIHPRNYMGVNNASRGDCYRDNIGLRDSSAIGRPWLLRVSISSPSFKPRDLHCVRSWLKIIQVNEVGARCDGFTW